MTNRTATRLIDRLPIYAGLVASWLGLAPLCAADAPSTPTATSTATPTATGPVPAVVVGSSQDNFVGDRVTFPVNMTVTVDPGGGRPIQENRCLRAGTPLRGVGQFVKGAPKVNFVVISKCSPWLGFIPGNNPEEGCSDDVMCDGKGSLEMGTTIQIDFAEVQKNLPNRYGLAYGTLVVPFKFQLTGDHQLTGSATLGPYLGYRFATENYGLATTVAAFGGISNISVSKTKTDPTTMKVSATTEQIAGFGYGGAVMIEVKGGFQAGAVLGFDSVGSNEGFQYNNKPWLALELGYSFSQ